MGNIIISTTDIKQPYEIYDVLFSVTTEGLHVGLDWIASWKNLLGGRIKGYERNVKRAQTKALKDLKAQAQEIGCDAVIGINQRIESIPVGKNAAIIVSLSGTAVKLLPSSPSIKPHHQSDKEIAPPPIREDSPTSQQAYNP